VVKPSGLAASYAACERLARSHYENFPVASRLLPAELRKHVAAVYAFARVADDVADEPGRGAAQRIAILNAYRQRLMQGTKRSEDSGYRLPNAMPAEVDQIPVEFFPALFDTIQRFELPVPLFTDLLSAFEQDVTKSRYETWSEVLDYCRRSANPVGRIVLRLCGYRDETLDRASDDVCTALQLTNFWQDLAIDWSRGRLYVPEEVWLQRGAATASLDRREWTPAWRASLEECGRRTRLLFDRGRPVCDGVTGRLRYELRATWTGGTRVLERLQAQGFDVFDRRPRLGARDWAAIGWHTLWWR
jgi:squalene synthase HpnC